MNILLLSRYDRLGASSRVRLFQYLPFLAQHGANVTVSPMLADSYIQTLYAGKRWPPNRIAAAYVRRFRTLRHSSRFDLVWIEKEAAPWTPAWCERRLNRRAVPYVVDYDDAVFHAYEHHRLPVVRRIMGTKIDEVMRRAAIVIAGNSYLADRARLAGAARVEIVPTVVDLDRYTVRYNDPERTFTIGWVGTPVTTKYLHAVEAPLAAACAGNAARFVAVGARGINLDSQEIRSWSEETEISDIQSFDCGVMPLPDGKWERGKCGYKLVQYMACGVPVVASPVGVNLEIVEHGTNGFLASNADEWSKALTDLRDCPALRKQLGIAARTRVEQAYSLQVTAPRILSILQKAASTS